MIELINIRKSFDALESFVVEDISLSVAKGELLGLIGESGCGKTTTLKMINRLEEPTSGSIEIDGRDVLHADPNELRRNIGYVFQGVGLFPHWSVAENVGVVPTLLKWPVDQIKQAIEASLDLVGLDTAQFGSRFPDELSGGQRQRVGVARALAAKPKIMLMDEPFGAIDPINRSALQEEFKRIQKRLGLTVIMVTHDMTEALLMADRIAIMKQGRILQVGTPSNLLNDPQHDYVRELLESPRQKIKQLEALTRAETA